MREILTDLSTCVRDENIMEALLKQFQTQSDIITAVRTILRTAKGATPPIDFSSHANIEGLFEGGGGTSEDQRIGFENRTLIMMTIKHDTLARVDRDVCFGTKFNALNALATMSEIIMPTDALNERADFVAVDLFLRVLWERLWLSEKCTQTRHSRVLLRRRS